MYSSRHCTAGAVISLCMSCDSLRLLNTHGNAELGARSSSCKGALRNGAFSLLKGARCPMFLVWLQGHG
jgi:hypothetical protein